MSFTVLRQTLRQVRRTLGVLALGVGAFFYLVLLASSSFLEEAPDLPFFQSPPKAMTAFLGGSADFFHADGWLSAAMTHPVILSLLTSSALLVAAGSVATEVERGTIDLVLVRPVGRVRFLLAKALASILAVTAAEAGFIALLIDGIGGLRFASPFHYFRPIDLLAGNASGGDWLILGAVPVVALFWAAVWFTRRDLTR